MSPADMIRQQVAALMADGEAGQALELLQKILQDEPCPASIAVESTAGAGAY